MPFIPRLHHLCTMASTYNHGRSLALAVPEMVLLEGTALTPCVGRIDPRKMLIPPLWGYGTGPEMVILADSEDHHTLTKTADPRSEQGPAESVRIEGRSPTHGPVGSCKHLT